MLINFTLLILNDLEKLGGFKMFNKKNIVLASLISLVGSQINSCLANEQAGKAILNTPLTQIAMGPGHHPFMMGSECPMAEKLNLSDDQYSKLWQLKDELKDQLEPKEAELHVNKRHLMMALTADTIDSTKTKELEDKILTLKAEMCKLKMDHKIKAMNVLNTDQRKEVNHAMFWSMMGPEMHKWGH